MQKGAEDAGEKNGVDYHDGRRQGDGDEDSQIKAIEAAVARGDKGILITPNGPGVNAAIENARDAKGLYVIALDTPPDPADTVDITFATDNFKAGELIGKWAAGTLNGKKATIAMLDLFNDKVATVDINRDQGFLTGMGIDTKDKTKNGDEAKTGKYTGGKGGDYQIVCNEPSQGAAGRGQDRDGELPVQEQGHQRRLHHQRAHRGRCGRGAAGCRHQGRIGRLGRRRLQPWHRSMVKDGTIGATSQQYPVKMARNGRRGDQEDGRQQWR